MKSKQENGSINYSGHSMYDTARFIPTEFSARYRGTTMITDYLENPSEEAVLDVDGKPHFPVYRIEITLPTLKTVIGVEYLSPALAVADILEQERHGYIPRVLVVTHVQG